MMSEKTLKEKRRDMGAFTFSAQMLQNPIAESVRTFRDEWLVDCVYTATPPRDAMNVYILVDGANSKRKSADRTTMLVIGLNSDRNYYLLDGEYGRMNLAERTDALFRLHRKWSPQGVFWEQQGAMSDVAHVEDVMNNRENYRFVITPITRGPKDNKVRRITNLQAPFAAHRLWIPQYSRLLRTYTDENGEQTVHDIVKEFVEGEYQTFPNAPHDDFLDTLADLLDEQVASRMRWPKPKGGRTAFVRKEGTGEDAAGLFAR
jgi:phage terminase large subunit-like protein